MRSSTQLTQSAFLILIAGIIVLAVVMGIGRFAYTPILPIMVDETALNNETAGYLATSNYFGYLVGALLAGKLPWKKGKAFNVYVFFCLNAASTLWMGMTSSEWFWHTLRFVSGVTSGIVFVLVSSVILDTLARSGKLAYSGYLFGGVGLGILISGIVVPLFFPIIHWDGLWIMLGILSFALGIFVLRWIKDPPKNKSASETSATSPTVGERPRLLPWLAAAYCLEGIGYVISGTYLVAFAAEIPFLQSAPSLSWVFVGAAAAPSCVMWSAIATRIGNLPALQAAFFVQVIGIALPVLFYNAYGALIGAILFGATFMGIVTMTMAEGRAAATVDSSRVIGNLTFFYGAGQMIGPAAAAVMISLTGTLTSAFYLAVFILVAGMIILAAGQLQHKRDRKTSPTA